MRVMGVYLRTSPALGSRGAPCFRTFFVLVNTCSAMMTMLLLCGHMFALLMPKAYTGTVSISTDRLIAIPIDFDRPATRVIDHVRDRDKTDLK